MHKLILILPNIIIDFVYLSAPGASRVCAPFTVTHYWMCAPVILCAPTTTSRLCAPAV